MRGALGEAEAEIRRLGEVTRRPYPTPTSTPQLKLLRRHNLLTRTLLRNPQLKRRKKNLTCTRTLLHPLAPGDRHARP